MLIKKYNKLKKSVKQMVKEYEDKITPIPAPATKKVPAPLPKTKITPLKQALKNFVQSFEVGIKFKNDPLTQLNNAALFIENYLKNISKDKKVLNSRIKTFQKPKENKT